MTIRKKSREEKDLEGRIGQEQLKRADHDGVSTEQILAEDQMVGKFGIPTTWEDADKPIDIKGPGSTIHKPTDQETASYALSPRRTICGQCRHHDLERGRKEIMKQGLAQRLTMDESWCLRHLGAPLDTFGLCAEDPSMITSVMGQACDHFTKKGGR